MGDVGQYLITGGASVLSTVVGALGGWAVSRKTTQRTADAEVQKAINAGFATLAERYEASNLSLANRVRDLESAVLQLNVHIETLEGALRANSIPVPPRVIPFPIKAQA